MAAVLEAVHEKAVVGDLVYLAQLPRVDASQATARFPIFVAPFDLNLRQIAIINSTALSGAATNHTNINLIDGGLEGAGTAEFANVDYASGTDQAVGKTVLFDGTTTVRAFTQGDLVECEVEEVGTGFGALTQEMLFHIVLRAA